MGNEHFGNLVNVIGAIMASLATLYLLFIRFKHKSIMSKYEPDTAAYDAYSKLFKPSYLIISATVALLFIISLVYSKQTNSSHPGNSHPSLFFILFIVLVAALIFFMAFTRYRKK